MPCSYRSSTGINDNNLFHGLCRAPRTPTGINSNELNSGYGVPKSSTVINNNNIHGGCGAHKSSKGNENCTRGGTLNLWLKIYDFIYLFHYLTE